ncbi:hypothetical protein BKA80DRAFT_57314 [Phyllosticta citrichinensis]
MPTSHLRSEFAAHSFRKSARSSPPSPQHQGCENSVRGFSHRVSKACAWLHHWGEGACFKACSQGAPRPSPPLTVRLHEKSPELRVAPLHTCPLSRKLPLPAALPRLLPHYFNPRLPRFSFCSTPLLGVGQGRAHPRPPSQANPALSRLGGDVLHEERSSPAPGPAAAAAENLSTPPLDPLVVERR